MSVTIRDISKKSGYSCATISRVLSNKVKVKEDTRKRILEVIKEMGYNYVPREASKKTSDTFMIILGDFMNPFHMEIAQAINESFDKNNYYTAVFNSSDNPDKEEELILYAQNHGFLGVLMITAAESKKLIEILKKVTIPVLFINRFLRSIDNDIICVDNYIGGYMATQYLIEMGHRKILHLAGPQNYTTTQDRCKGFIAAMNDAGLKISQDDIIYGSIKAERGYKYGKILAAQKDKYTAVFSMNDIIAAALVNSLFEEGVKVPDDISIISFDDTPMAVAGRIKLTTISKDTKSMGEAAVELMLYRIKNRDSPSRKITFTPSLIIRDSVKKIR